MSPGSVRRAYQFIEAYLVGVLGRGRRGDESDINTRAKLEQQAPILQQRADLGKDLLGEPTPLQLVSKPRDRRLAKNVVAVAVQSRQTGASTRYRTARPQPPFRARETTSAGGLRQWSTGETRKAAPTS